MTTPTIEEVRALDRFLAESGTPKHQQTLQGILRSHEALYHAARVENPDDGVVIIRDSAGAPVYAIETKTAKTGHATDDETLRVLKDMLSYQLLPDVVREHLAAYRDALIEMPTPEETKTSGLTLGEAMPQEMYDLAVAVKELIAERDALRAAVNKEN